jgi:hypothetical protein
MFLSITNKGEMQQEAMTLLGASTKRGDDTKIGILVCNEGRAAQSVLLADGSQRLYSCPVGQCVLVKNRWFNREEGDQKFSFDANCVEPPGTHGSEGVDHIGHPIGDDRLQK